MYFNYAGNNSTSNSLSWGFYDNDFGMTLGANNGLAVGWNGAVQAAPANGLTIKGNVGIGTTDPGSARLAIVTPSGGDRSGISISAPGNYAMTIDNNQFVRYKNNSGTPNLTLGVGADDITYLGAQPTHDVYVVGDNGGVYVKANGNVGIGTTAPGELLSVGYGANSSISVGSNTNNKTFLGSYGDNTVFAINRRVSDGVFTNTSLPTASFGFYTSSGDSSIRFGTANANNVIDTERMRIDKNGNVGIGTSNPAYPLHVYKQQNAITAVTVDNDGGGAGVGQALLFKYGSTGILGGVYHQYDGSGWNLKLNVWNNFVETTPLFIKGLNGNVGIGTTAPGAKLHVLGANYNSAIVDAALYPELHFYSNGVDFGNIGSGNIGGSATETDLGIQTVAGKDIYLAAGGTTPQLTIIHGGALGLTIANVLAINGTAPLPPLIALSIAGTGFGSFGSAGQALTGGTATDLAFQTNSGNNILFATGGTALSNVRMYISNNGNVGIGTASPSSLLQVGNSSTADGVQLTVTDADGNCTLNPGSGAGWACTSDRRLKKSIASMDVNSSLSKILQLNPSTFQMRVNSKPGVGFIAEEVQKVIPEAVSTFADNTLGLDATRMIPYMVGAIQEQQKQIAMLKKLAGVQDLTGDGTVGSGAVAGLNNSSFLARLGILIQDGIANIASLAVDSFNVKTARIQEMEMVATNGDVYCTWLNDTGDWQKVKGNCATVGPNVTSVLAVARPMPTPDKSPEGILTGPSQSGQESSLVGTPTPTPIPDIISPEATPSPTPSPTQTPTPDQIQSAIDAANAAAQEAQQAANQAAAASQQAQDAANSAQQNQVTPTSTPASTVLNIVSVVSISDINIAYGSTLASANLPSTVNATLSDGSIQALVITWDNGNPAFDQNTAGTYAFSGILATSSTIANPNNIAVTANVIVASQPVNPVSVVGDAIQNSTSGLLNGARSFINWIIQPLTKKVTVSSLVNGIFNVQENIISSLFQAWNGILKFL